MASGTPEPPPSYGVLLRELQERIRGARLRAALAVNQELVTLYWGIGADILARQRSEGWGARVIDRLAENLRRAFPEMTGLSARNLKYMRAFAEAYPDHGNRATGRCTIAVGPQRPAPRGREGLRRARVVRPAGDRERLEPQRARAPDRGRPLPQAGQ